MKISVVIPTFNTGKNLYDLFSSLEVQSIGFDNIEVIFVDDASDDEVTLDILEELDYSFDNVSVVYLDDNSGFPGRSRNIGLKKASGDYVIFSDHDDSYNEDAFERMYDEIILNDSDMVISNFNQVNREKVNKFKSSIDEKVVLKSYKDNLDIFQVPAAIWTRLFKREFLIDKNISFLEGMLCEDVYVATLANFKASNIVYLPDLYGYNYSIRDSSKDKSTVHLRNKKYIEAILNGYLEIVKWVDENNPEYGKDIFRKHLTSWLYTIVLSKLSDEDRQELFEKSQIVFKKYYSEDPYFDGNYNRLVEYILNSQFSNAVNESHEIAKYQENMNDGNGLFKRIKSKIMR